MFEAAGEEYVPMHIEFKAGSEHTIDRQRYDGELQITFKPKNDETSSIHKFVLCILFDADMDPQQRK